MSIKRIIIFLIILLKLLKYFREYREFYLSSNIKSSQKDIKTDLKELKKNGIEKLMI